MRNRLPSYVYGLELIEQDRINGTHQTTSYDGHGSVRALADPTGTVTDTYDYDAFEASCLADNLEDRGEFLKCFSREGFEHAPKAA